jgi:4-oxalmesaconate hydratase
MLKQPRLDTHVMNNVFFDTCVYHQPGINLLAEVIDTKNILFGSEMVGAVRGIDPETGHHFDDTKRYIDALAITQERRHAIFEGNARRVFPRLDAKLKERGL